MPRDGESTAIEIRDPEPFKQRRLLHSLRLFWPQPISGLIRFPISASYRFFSDLKIELL